MSRGIKREKLEGLLVRGYGLLALGFGWLVYRSGMERGEKLLCLAFAVLSAGIGVLYWRILRGEVLLFSDTVCSAVDTLTGGEAPKACGEEDTLTSKIQTKLDKLSDATYSAVVRQTGQKQEIQKMVSDISHQLKTPIANITMYSSMLEQEHLGEEQRKKFLEAVNSQVGKLEFLVDALAKMSRLESGLIHLEQMPVRIFDTLFGSVSQVSAKARGKQIEISMDCEEQLVVPHDPKWTEEALFNILDNAVKYTPERGRIVIRVEPWELFTRIDIEDTGIGIAKEHYEDIFKRFYREGKVRREEGVGIGLYLSREIIGRQGGYIKVKSQEGKGTVFSVFLRNQDEPGKGS